jgi:DNA invertase Pin-like site-specific DNA recombinase
MSGVVVPDRRKALLLLAGSRYDVYAPGPKVGKAFQHGKAAATVKEPCLLCDGDRVTRDKFGREQPCESCKGRGWHKVDPMLNKQAESWEEQKQASANTRRVLCDRCAGQGVWKNERCGMCDGAGKVSVSLERAILSDADRETDVVLNEWERMLVRREESGSYREFDKCVAELEPHRRRVFHEVHVVKTASAGMLHPTQAIELERAMVQLLKWMPREIVVPREILALEKRVAQAKPKGRHAPKNLMAARDAEIAVAYEGGKRTPEIASEFGLSDSQVQKILNEAAA